MTRGPEDLDRLAARLAAARRLSVVTGAGVSAASGVPTFRGAEGLWRHHRPEDLATPEAFERHPDVVWEWYAWRRAIVDRCEPNAAHVVLARWSRRPGVALITQNVDGLHERAGARALISLHGSIWELRCHARCAGSRPFVDRRVPLPELPPRCTTCGGLLRPGVVWFGEPLPTRALDAAIEATACDVFLTVGTSAVVYPAAALTEEAKRRGAYTVEINLEPTRHTRLVDLAIAGDAGAILEALDRLRPGAETEPSGSTAPADDTPP